MIKITEQGGRLVAESPYHPDLPTRAKKLGGKFESESKAWVFDLRDLDRVRELYRKLYGTDGSSPADVLTIRVPASVCDRRGDGAGSELYLAGRLVARAFGRDTGARLGDGVVVLSGGFSSGGSMKNFKVTYRDGTTIEIRDVPRAAAEQVHAEYHGVALLDAAGQVVAEATHEEQDPAVAVAAELASIDSEILELERKLAALRDSAASLRGARAA